MTLIEQIDRLVDRQLQQWPFARDNYNALNEMLTRELWLHDSNGNRRSRIILQHNPARVRSTAAPLSAQAIEKRPCFLCDENQPREQEAVMWKSSNHERMFKIQVNPYPIFKRHLTISLVEHEPQQCYYHDMIALAAELPGHVIFYNGEGCGASAPDHMHFQATLSSELPLLDELAARDGGGLDTCYGNRDLWMDSDTGRPLIYIRTSSHQAAVVHDMFQALRGWKRNVLCRYDGNTWHIVIFPRTKGRPQCYDTRGDGFLISPASVEYAGVWVLPRLTDFNRIDEDIITQVYSELSCNDEQLKAIYYNYVRVN